MSALDAKVYEVLEYGHWTGGDKDEAERLYAENLYREFGLVAAPLTQRERELLDRLWL